MCFRIDSHSPPPSLKNEVLTHTHTHIQTERERIYIYIAGKKPINLTINRLYTLSGV